MMSTLQVVQDVYAAFQRGDIPGVLANMSPDVDWMLAGDPKAIPVAGSRHGVLQVAGLQADACAPGVRQCSLSQPSLQFASFFQISLGSPRPI